MAQLPGPLADLDLGEPSLGYLRTGAQYPFIAPDDGEEKLASIWFVVCRSRCWLVAATRTDQWSVGDADVSLEKGWTWDAVRVGEWTVPLRSGTRSSAEKLMKQWRMSTGGGRPVEPPTSQVVPEGWTGRARAASGAYNLPGWLAETTPAPPDARWLYAYETDREIPLLNTDGSIDRVPIWFAISDRSTTLVAHRGSASPAHPNWLRPVDPPVEHRERTAARDQLVAAGWTLPGALVDRKTGLAAALANAAHEAAHADARWGVAVEQAIDAGEPSRALELLREAFVLGRHTTCWLSVGAFALEAGEAESAVGAALCALEEQPDLDLEPAAVAWARRRPAVRDVEPSAVKTALTGVFEECRTRSDGRPWSVPDGIPWPPDGPIEAMAIAAIVLDQDRTIDALTLWKDHGAPPRVQQAIAATTVNEDDPSAAASEWWAAAERWRPLDPEASLDAAERALTAAPERSRAALHYRIAAWRWTDAEDPPTDAIEAHWAAALPEAPPDGLDQATDAWRALAEQAAAAEAFETAVHAWRQVRDLDSTERAALFSEATVLETRLDRPDQAIEALRLLAERTEEAVEPEPARWFVWTELARLLDGPEATSALKEAVRGDFLVPAAWVRALEIAEQHRTAGTAEIDDATVRWWRHVHRQLAGPEAASAVPGESSGPRAPERDLAGEALDGLHPGGVGWLERARHSLDTTDPPPITELTRGLERVQPAAWPRLYAALSNLSEALKIPPPDVFVFRGTGAWGLSAWPTEPPIILVGHDHLVELPETDPADVPAPDAPSGDSGDSGAYTPPLAMTRDALSFALAVELVHLAARHPLLSFDGGLVGTSRSVYNAFGRYAGTAETVVDLVTLLPGIDQISKVQTVIKLSRRVFTARSVVDKTTDLATRASSFGLWKSTDDDTPTIARSYVGPALQFRIQADRAALLLTGDLHAAIEAILRGQPDTAVRFGAFERDGLVAALDGLDEDTTLRIASLVEFAATL